MKRLQQTHVSVDFGGRDTFHASMYLEYPSLEKDGNGSNCDFYCYNMKGNNASKNQTEAIYNRLQTVEQIARVRKLYKGHLKLELGISRLSISSIIELAKAIAIALDIPSSGVEFRMIRQITYVKAHDESEMRKGWISLDDYLNEKHFK